MNFNTAYVKLCLHFGPVGPVGVAPCSLPPSQSTPLPAGCSAILFADLWPKVHLAAACFCLRLPLTKRSNFLHFTLLKYYAYAGYVGDGRGDYSKMGLNGEWGEWWEAVL